MMMWMLRREDDDDMMRGKMLMLRRMMLRMKTDPKTGKKLCASQRSRNAHGHCTRAILNRNLQVKNGRGHRGNRFVRPAQSKCT